MHEVCNWMLGISWRSAQWQALNLSNRQQCGMCVEAQVQEDMRVMGVCAAGCCEFKHFYWYCIPHHLQCARFSENASKMGAQEIEWRPESMVNINLSHTLTSLLEERCCWWHFGMQGILFEFLDKWATVSAEWKSSEGNQMGKVSWLTHTKSYFFPWKYPLTSGRYHNKTSGDICWEYLIHSPCIVNIAHCNFKLIGQLNEHFKEHFGMWRSVYSVGANTDSWFFLCKN
jgi:hypothetical protein